MNNITRRSIFTGAAGLAVAAFALPAAKASSPEKESYYLVFSDDYRVFADLLGIYTDEEEALEVCHNLQAMYDKRGFTSPNNHGVQVPRESSFVGCRNVQEVAASIIGYSAYALGHRAHDVLGGEDHRTRYKSCIY